MSRTGDPYPLVRSPWERTATAPDLSPAEAEIVAAFETAPTPPEVREAAVVEEVARAMADEDLPGFPFTALADDELDRYRRLAAAAVAAYRATQDGGAEEAVRRVEAAEGAVIRATQLAQQWKINAQSATDPGIAVVALFAAEQLLAVLAPQAGEAGQ